MLEILSKLLGGGSGDGEALRRISTHFAKLDKYQISLAKDVAVYVVRDTGSSVLSTLSTQGASRHWRGVGMVWPPSSAFKEVFKPGVDWSDGQLARLGDVIAALQPLTANQYGIMGTAKSPDWLRHALAARTPRNEKAGDIAEIVRLAASRGLGADIVGDIVFSPDPITTAPKTASTCSPASKPG